MKHEQKESEFTWQSGEASLHFQKSRVLNPSFLPFVRDDGCIIKKVGTARLYRWKRG